MIRDTIGPSPLISPGYEQVAKVNGQIYEGTNIIFFYLTWNNLKNQHNVITSKMYFYDVTEISVTEIQKAKHLGSLKEESNRTKVELILTEVRATCWTQNRLSTGTFKPKLIFTRLRVNLNLNAKVFDIKVVEVVPIVSSESWAVETEVKEVAGCQRQREE